MWPTSWARPRRGNNSGSFDTNTGFNSTGALHVRVGNRTPTTATVLPISGGWVKQLPVPSAGTYTITFKYRLVVSPHYDTGEFIESVFKVDDTRLGGVQASGSLSGSGVSLYRFTGKREQSGGGGGGGHGMADLHPERAPHGGPAPVDLCPV